ncbi:chymotrypsinogen B-like [Convolutriloba macropyga]|uniref:chymotrypsinogen B-like n=1 Tax=Convolutriloba macropyga TaxID=536237 RepID=UPI003F5253A7
MKFNNYPFPNLFTILLFFIKHFAINETSVAIKTAKNVEKNLKLNSFVNSFIINGFDSPPRLFYVRLKETSGFCGGTLVAKRWILTSAHCVYNKQPTNILAELGDFSMMYEEKSKRYIDNIFIHPNYRRDQISPNNDLALLKLHTQVQNETWVSNICTQDDCNPVGMILGACGMGLTSTPQISMDFPARLQEMHFHEATFSSVNPFEMATCPDTTICTFPIIEGGNVCYADDGGPLYKLSPSSNSPACLYGVTSYFLNRADTPGLQCNAGSFFTRLTMSHRLWIGSVVLQNYF